MAHDLTPALDDNAPALAGAIVYHAKTLCDQVDTRWRLLNQVSIPVTELADTRNQNEATFSTESMARLYISQTVYDLTQSELADRLANRPALLKGFGMTKPPTQQNISYAWSRFSTQTKTTLEAAALVLSARSCVGAVVYCISPVIAELHRPIQIQMSHIELTSL